MLVPVSDRSVRERCVSLWHTGIAAVEGRSAVRGWLSGQPFLTRPVHIAAVGKAAGSMLEGALDILPSPRRSLLITKDNHVSDRLRASSRLQIIESAHPVPDERSLVAGASLRRFVETVPRGEHLLFLVSGGASALAEDPEAGVTLSDIEAFNRSALSNGANIREINAGRIALSRIKGGKLLALAPEAHLHVLQISDVEQGDEELIGSGIASLERVRNRPTLAREVVTVGDNARARMAIALAAAGGGLPLVENSETLYGDLTDVALRLARTLMDGREGVYIWGGEPTVHLPANPGHGGRNQSLALALGLHLHGHNDVHALVAGTDGTDGPTSAAGGHVPHLSKDNLPAARQALSRADAGPFLAARNCLFASGPTGTNVMDIVVAVKAKPTRKT